MDIVVLLIASAVFGGVWWGMERLQASVFFVAALAFLAAMLVYASRTLFGLPL